MEFSAGRSMSTTVFLAVMSSLVWSFGFLLGNSIHRFEWRWRVLAAVLGAVVSGLVAWLIWGLAS